jgi:YebC/PmpR family DNA-binding regulatory protein
MSGHSKWSTIKRKKGAADAKRGQMFTKLGREIGLAAREGGGDPDMNFRLRLAVDRAKAANMPRDNIERAIERRAGTGKGESLEELTYEGYGPSGTAMFVAVLTDNRNRSVAEVRSVFTRLGGNLGENGCVAWLFDRKGYITLAPNGGDPEEMALIAIDAGAEDVRIDSEVVEVFTEMADLRSVREELEANGLKIEDSELSWIPKSTMALDGGATIKNMKLIDALEELDDVMQVYSNLEISDEVMTEYAGSD